MLDGRSEAMPVSELAGGARIRHIYQDIFVKGLDQLNPSRCDLYVSCHCECHHECFMPTDYYPLEMQFGALCSELSDEDVRTAIKNSGGVKGSLLIPEAPFELLVRMSAPPAPRLLRDADTLETLLCRTKPVNQVHGTFGAGAEGYQPASDAGAAVQGVCARRAAAHCGAVGAHGRGTLPWLAGQLHL